MIRIRKELWFGFSLMAVIVMAALYMLISVPQITNGHYGLLMLSLVVVAIMLGFPTAFTLMGMGMMFAFFAYHSGGQTGAGAVTQTLDLMVQRAFSVMGSDVLIAIPLFVFMGYLVERANLIEKLFGSLHLALARVPGSLGVATLVTCAVFATATGIVGAVVTLMGLLALPQMMRAGYDVRLSAGAITAGGCLGILIPPSVLLIVYGATAGVSVVQLYAGAFFPGIMLAGLYILYMIIVAKVKPALAPPLTAAQRYVPIPPRLVAVGATTDGARVAAAAGRAQGQAQRRRVHRLSSAPAVHHADAAAAVRDRRHLELAECHCRGTRGRDRRSPADRIAAVRDEGRCGRPAGAACRVSGSRRACRAAQQHRDRAAAAWRWIGRAALRWRAFGTSGEQRRGRTSGVGQRSR